MNIGVIGAGRIGTSVGQKWIDSGHDVMFGLRDLSKGSDLPGKRGSIEAAVQHGDVVLFAIPGRAMTETTQAVNLGGKIVIDATNGGDVDGKPLVQFLTESLPKSTVYKAFNTLGFENFAEPKFANGIADLLFVGPDSQLDTVSQLIADVGLNPLHVGDIDRMNILDAGMRFWFALSQRYGRHIAFSVLVDN